MKNKIFILSLLLVCMCPLAKAQKVAEKTNILYWLTTSPNAAVEFSLSRYLTVDVLASYNPWDFSNKTSFRHWLFQPEVRYWPCSRYTKYFFGVHGIYGKYNISEVPLLAKEKEISYQGSMYGGGISFGYHIILNGRWGLELSLGVGYARLDYDKYQCKECREKLGHYKRDYFGPTKIGVSFLYMIR